MAYTEGPGDRRVAHPARASLGSPLPTARVGKGASSLRPNSLLGDGPKRVWWLETGSQTAPEVDAMLTSSGQKEQEPPKQEAADLSQNYPDHPGPDKPDSLQEQAW